MHDNRQQPKLEQGCTQMKRAVRVVFVAIVLKAVCFAQEPSVVVTGKGKQKWSAAEVNKIYLSAGGAVQREFGSSSTPIRPRITLVLGADKDSVDLDRREVFLVRWDPNLFAQGAVQLAFGDLMPPERRTAIAKRALRWADATVAATQLSK